MSFLLGLVVLFMIIMGGVAIVEWLDLKDAIRDWLIEVLDLDDEDYL